MKYYEKKYNEFWKDIVEDKYGNLDRDQVKRELFDFSNVIDNVRKVYSEITCGDFSDPLINPKYITDAVEKRHIDREIAFEDIVLILGHKLDEEDIEELRRYLLK